MHSQNKRQAKSGRKASTIRPAQIDRLRESYVAMIGTARLFDRGPNAFLDKAHSLLTTHWAHATWASRATILKSVDWLLQAGIRHAPTGDRRTAGKAKPA
jgi:hypothetical protein